MAQNERQWGWSASRSTTPSRIAKGCIGIGLASAFLWSGCGPANIAAPATDALHGQELAAAKGVTSIVFDPPGSVETFAQDINAAGEIVGFYLDANFAGHGFLRTPDGKFTTLDVPGAVILSGSGTL